MNTTRFPSWIALHTQNPLNNKNKLELSAAEEMQLWKHRDSEDASGDLLTSRIHTTTEEGFSICSVAVSHQIPNNRDGEKKQEADGIKEGRSGVKYVINKGS